MVNFQCYLCIWWAKATGTCMCISLETETQFLLDSCLASTSNELMSFFSWFFHFDCSIVRLLFDVSFAFCLLMFGLSFHIPRDCRPIDGGWFFSHSHPNLFAILDWDFQLSIRQYMFCVCVCSFSENFGRLLVFGHHNTIWIPLPAL